MKRNLQHILRRQQIRVGRLLAGLGFPDYTILTIFSVVMGIIAGLTGVGLHELIAVISELSFDDLQPGSAFGIIIIFIPMLGMIIQGVMRKLAPKQAAERGVLEIIKAVGLHDGCISFKTTLFHFLAPAICIGTGGTVGPEAPAAQAGAGAVAATGRLMGITRSRQRVFTAAGAGAAIAAIFNTPLAGVFFAIEVILLHDFRASALSAFLLASVSASAVSRTFLGNEPVLHLGLLQIGSYRFLALYLVLGIAAGFLAVAFIRSNEWLAAGFKKMNRRVPRIVVMAGVGIIMGVAGYWQPKIFGVGYGALNEILSNSLLFDNILILLLLKFLLVGMILGAGGFGGVFAPSLFLGACGGYLYAVGVSNLFGISLDTTTYTLVGMGATLAGINSVPLTAIMMLFEMTNDYHFILPLMLGVVGSTIVVQMVLKGSIYARALERQGYQYALSRDARILESIEVKKVMRNDILLLDETTPLAKLIQTCLGNPHDTVYTTDDSGRINGVIPSNTLRELITEYHELKTMIIARDLADPKIPILEDTDNLDQAMRMFSRYRVEEIPVARAGSHTEILGALHYQDVLKAYNNAKVRVNLTQGLAGDLKTISPDETQDVMPGFSIANVEVPAEFVNKTLRQLQLRNRYGVDVLMIEIPAGPFSDDEQERKRLFPDINHTFQTGEHIIIFGDSEHVKNLRSLTMAAA